MKKLLVAAVLAAVAFATGCSKEQIEGDGAWNQKAIKATFESFDEYSALVGVEEETETRVVVSDETLGGGSWAFYWEPGDAMGVFTNDGENNIKYVNNATANATTATFVPESATVSGTPTYAYYPYSEEAGNDVSAIVGNIPEQSTINSAMNNIPGIIRRGTHTSTEAGVSTFGFRFPFAAVNFRIDATDTKLEGLHVKSVKVLVKRYYFRAVPICGDYELDLTDLSYTTSNTSNEMTFNFEGYPSLTEALSFATTMLPNIKKSDRLYFTVTACGYTATFNVGSSVAMAANGGYVYELPMANYNNLSVKSNNEVYVEPETPSEGEDSGDAGSGTEGEEGDNTEGDNTEGEGTEGGETTEPETPTTTTTGSFTCATYNVDGLPSKISFVTINSDGPGSSGTTSISQKIATRGWDFVGFSEDFTYNGELMSALSSAYTFGTHRGTISSSALFGTIDTDGLQFATKNETCGFGSTESWTAFTSSYGGLTSGANTCIKKGFRHYVVTMADGIEVDVLITHMNTYSSSGTSHIDAQHAQLKQIAQYINTISANNRPIIFMGDTNCRYTRHDFETYFWSVLNSDLTYADPWVEYQWAGVYPTYPSNSLMVSDATGTSDSDIICSTTQNGEVVDKVIYINKSGNPVQIKAESYLRDYDNFNGLADHMPIVVEFTWTKTE